MQSSTASPPVLSRPAATRARTQLPLLAPPCCAALGGSLRGTSLDDFLSMLASGQLQARL